MNLILNSAAFDHDTGRHPENRKRLQAFDHLPDVKLPDAEPFLELVHTSDYIDRVRRACAAGAPLDEDTVTSTGSFKAALQGVAATLLAMEQQDFAITRPPGHHAYPERASGFCLFNNVAIAARKAANEGKKVLIFDFDGHLGDGTEHIFYEDNQVLFWSLHQYPAFPGNGYVNEIGKGKGKGYTVNVPLPAGSGDDIFMQAVRAFLPVAEQFDPDVVAVSAGFDAHQYDLLLGLRATGNSFHQIGQLLREYFQYKELFAVLEGGYNVEELPKCIYNFVAGVDGQDIPFEETKTVSGMRTWESFDINLHAAISNLSPYWEF